MAPKWIQALIRAAVADYLDRLPDEVFMRLGTRIMGAEGLTDAQVKRMIDSASGERVIEIHFNNGDMAVISNRQTARKEGPGW